MANVLVMDDDEQVRQVFRDALEDGGHHVFEAADGKQGLHLLSEEAIDLAFVDVFMPNVDGLEVVQKLRGRNSGLTVIAMSGGAPVDLLRMAKLLGADETLHKPAMPDEIAAIVERCV